MIDSLTLRRQFPFLNLPNPPVYFDSAATTQKPNIVLDAMREFYEHSSANPHRGMHMLSEAATNAYESARETVQRCIGATHSDEIIFTKNATEAINLVANSWGRKNLKKDDVVVLSVLEHHSNIVPWLMLKESLGIQLEWIDCDKQGSLDLKQYEKVLESGKVKLVAITAQSNVLGVRPPLKEMISKAHAAHALVLVDAAQYVAHGATDVTNLDCDFLVFSGHKLYGPTGIGVLYSRREILKDMPPFLGGGMMIENVTKDSFTSSSPPLRFEAGTMPAAEAVGLATAITWLQSMDRREREIYEAHLIDYAQQKLSSIKGLSILGPQKSSERFGIVAFTIDGIHPHDLTDILGKAGFALRAGHHCAQPLHAHLGITASSRLSIGLYNTIGEIDSLIPAICEAITRF